MAETFFPAAGGGGGGQVILRAEGPVGNHVKATLGNKVVEGVVPENGVLQLKLPGLGLWEVDTEAEDSMYHSQQEVKVYRYGITPCWAVAKKEFSDCTPEEIQYISRTGFAKEFWNIGDRHAVQMTNDEEIFLQIYDFDHDNGADGETVLPLTLGMENCFKTTRSINQSRTNSGGWASSYFRTNTVSTLKQNFPIGWQNIMTRCQKKNSNGATIDDLFLFSEVELKGYAKFTSVDEGKLYPIFTGNASRVKTLNGNPFAWWSRSICNDGQYNGIFFCLVGTNGTLEGGMNADSGYGIALGFCVG